MDTNLENSTPHYTARTTPPGTTTPTTASSVVDTTPDMRISYLKEVARLPHANRHPVEGDLGTIPL